MNLIDKYNCSCSEADMQASIIDHMMKKKFRHQQSRWVVDYIKAKVYSEIFIPRINRRSDVIVKLSDRKIFNIECKINDVGGVISQAEDHLYWANYSYVCLHAMTYIPSYQIKEMVEKGIGLMLWQDENIHIDPPRNSCLMDVFGASKSGKVKKDLRGKVLSTLRKYDVIQQKLPL